MCKLVCTYVILMQSSIACFLLRHFNTMLCFGLFEHGYKYMFCSCVKMFIMICICVFTRSHVYCSAQLSMSNTEKRYRNEIFNPLSHQVIRPPPLSLFLSRASTNNISNSSSNLISNAALAPATESATAISPATASTAVTGNLRPVSLSSVPGTTPTLATASTTSVPTPSKATRTTPARASATQHKRQQQHPPKATAGAERSFCDLIPNLPGYSTGMKVDERWVGRGGG